MYLWSGTAVANDKSFSYEIGPDDAAAVSERMTSRQRNDERFGPDGGRMTVWIFRCSRHESSVKAV